ncbi:MAG: sugar phosphate isomerase/epimerase family protein [Pirellulaceae bacterium]
MQQVSSRRQFMQASALAGFAAASLSRSLLAQSETKPKFKISLAQWSLHRTLRSGKLDNLQFAETAKKEFGIDGIEYVNQFFKDKAKDADYLAELNKRAADQGVTQLLIMVDGEGRLGDPDDSARTKAVENHYRWVEAAKELGCHSVRVNAGSAGEYEEQQKLAADGLRRLSEFAKPHGLNVIVENHGGLSSNGKWLAGTIEKVGMENCGTLPDFGNFWINRGGGEKYDNYLGTKELMPYAKAVSAKTYAFDDQGNEANLDYARLMDIVLSTGYDGWVGIEWEGGTPDEYEGIRLSKKLLERFQ